MKRYKRFFEDNVKIEKYIMDRVQSVDDEGYLLMKKKFKGKDVYISPELYQSLISYKGNNIMSVLETHFVHAIQKGGNPIYFQDIFYALDLDPNDALPLRNKVYAQYGKIKLYNNPFALGK